MTDIIVKIDSSGVAFVTLNRPRRRNAVSVEMWRELTGIFSDLGKNPEAKAVVLGGRGDHFCAGADIGEFEAARSSVAAGLAYHHDVEASTEAIGSVPKPTIAAINGFCLGGGCSLAMACDFRIAHTSARFGIPAARLGVVYDLSDCRHLLALVGLARAKRILFGGRQFDAAEAARIGFVDDVVDGSVERAAAELAESLAENAPQSIAGAKLTLDALARGEVEARRRELDAAFERSLESEDYREGVRAFLEKRQPRFTGR